MGIFVLANEGIVVGLMVGGSVPIKLGLRVDGKGVGTVVGCCEGNKDGA